MIKKILKILDKKGIEYNLNTQIIETETYTPGDDIDDDILNFKGINRYKSRCIEFTYNGEFFRIQTEKKVR